MRQIAPCEQREARIFHYRRAKQVADRRFVLFSMYGRDLRIRRGNKAIQFQGASCTCRKCALGKEHDVLVAQLRSPSKSSHSLVCDPDPLIQNRRRSLGEFLGGVIASMDAER